MGIIPTQVVVVEPTGAETELLLQVGTEKMVLVMHGRADVGPDDTVHVSLDPAKAHVFDGATGVRAQARIGMAFTARAPAGATRRRAYRPARGLWPHGRSCRWRSAASRPSTATSGAGF